MTFFPFFSFSCVLRRRFRAGEKRAETKWEGKKSRSFVHAKIRRGFATSGWIRLISYPPWIKIYNYLYVVQKYLFWLKDKPFLSSFQANVCHCGALWGLCIPFFSSRPQVNFEGEKASLVHRSTDRQNNVPSSENDIVSLSVPPLCPSSPVDRGTTKKRL